MDNLVLGPRPKLKKVGNRSEEVIFTLLTKSEEAEDIGNAVRVSGKIWRWHPLSVRHHDFSLWEEWITAVNDLEICLEAHKTVYLHCAAGIHRTGSLTYLYLRRKAYTPEQARAKVFSMRPIIEEQINTKMFDMEVMIQENSWNRV